MKKSYLLMTSLFLLTTVSLCWSVNPLRIGLKAGTSIPSLRDNGGNELSRDYESKVAQNFGIIADIGISSKLSIKTGLDFAGQGGIRNGQQPIPEIPAQFAQMVPQGTYLYASFDNEASLNYLEIPLMGKIELGNRLKYYLNAGPYVGFLLNAEQKTAGTSSLFFDKAGTIPVAIQNQPLPPVSMDATTNIEDDLRSTNYGLTGGIGLAYPLKNSTLLLDARAAYGLTSIQKDTETNGNSRTGGVFLTLGYMFSLGKSK